MKAGEQVTVIPVESDPYILEFQRYATISKVVDRTAWVRLHNVADPRVEFGPIPFARLLPGWRDGNGRFRQW